MKKILHFALMAALGVGLSLGATSCKDDDNNEATVPSESAEGQDSVTQKYWDVVGQLVGIGQYTEDYQDKTFEPTIGKPESEGSLTRVVHVNDMQAASQRFANLVDASGIDENTTSFNYDDPDVGTLTYTRMNSADALAVVDVNIKQVPHLKRIVYRAASDENGSFGDKKAYYRFGDIVKKQESDGKYSYWICVRPAFTLEGKEDSHWVCVNYLSKDNPKNLWEYTTKKGGPNNQGGIYYACPTAIGTDKVNMQNFAEMLWAICQPTLWQDNATNYHTDGKLFGFSGLPIFEDFSKKNLAYHNQFYWKNVQKAWKKLSDKGELKNALGLDWTQLNYMMSQESNAYVHLLYKGYSWITTFSWNLTLYEATYTNGTTDKERNMHHAVYESPQRNVESYTKGVDCSKMPGNVTAYNEFWNNSSDFRFFIRHATGAELNGGELGPTQKFNPNITRIYRYYDEYPWEEVRETGPGVYGPEITPQDMSVNIQYANRGFYDWGDVVQDDKGSRWFCVQPSAYGYDNIAGFTMTDYAYFISLDEKAVGRNLESATNNKALAAQILYDMVTVYMNSIKHKRDSTIEVVQRIRNIEKNCNVNFDELIAIRDTMYTYKNQSVNKGTTQLKNFYISTPYRNDNNQLCVLRMFQDNTNEQADGRREWWYRYYDRYTQGPSQRTMTLSDLDDQSIINSYNKDKWVYNTWYNYMTDTSIKDNTGPRTSRENFNNDYSHFLYKKGRNAPAGTIPANMYREPIIPFAVKMVDDQGHSATKFTDGTPFTHISLTLFELEDLYYDEQLSYVTTLYQPHHGARVDAILLNDQPWVFDLTNRP